MNCTSKLLIELFLASWAKLKSSFLQPFLEAMSTEMDEFMREELRSEVKMAKENNELQEAEIPTKENHASLEFFFSGIAFLQKRLKLNSLNYPTASKKDNLNGV